MKVPSERSILLVSRHSDLDGTNGAAVASRAMMQTLVWQGFVPEVLSFANGWEDAGSDSRRHATYPYRTRDPVRSGS
jgi:hypothetical protein